MSVKKRRPDEEIILRPTIEEQYIAYKTGLSEFYKKNKKKYIDGLYEQLVAAGIFIQDVQKLKDVPWQLIKMMAKKDFDADREK